MATILGNFNPNFKEKTAVEKALAWAKAHQEIVAVSVIVLCSWGSEFPIISGARTKTRRTPKAC